MRPILFQIGEYTFYSYSVAMGLALLVSILFIVRQAKREGYNPDRILEGCIIFAASGLVGARILYVALSWDYYRAHWQRIFTLSFTGFSAYGALFLSLVAALFWCRWRKVKFLDLADLMIPYYLVGYIIVRTGGCFLAGCCYGKAGAVPWAVVISTVDSWPRHPVQLYAAAGAALAYILLKLFYRVRPFPGSTVLVMFALYSLLRFTTEFFREGPVAWLGLTLAQLFSLALFLLSLAVLAGILFILQNRNISGDQA